MRTILYILLFLGGVPALFAETQADLNKAACDALQKTDAALNKVYQTVLKGYQNDKIFIKQFVAAQKKWIEFRDAYAASMYIPQYIDSYGSASTMCECYFIEKITGDRLKQLQVWVDGIAEGDVCIGSVKSTE